MSRGCLSLAGGLQGILGHPCGFSGRPLGSLGLLKGSVGVLDGLQGHFRNLRLSNWEHLGEKTSAQPGLGGPWGAIGPYGQTLRGMPKKVTEIEDTSFKPFAR